MLCQPEETIVAIASATGGSYRGTIRLSGPYVFDCLKVTLGPTHPPLDSIKSPSVATGYIPLEQPTAQLPCNIYYWPNQRSYTRQRAAEIHTLGSPPLLDAVLRKFCAAGARLAGPGEFTMRAFLAGRIDLPQAEAVWVLSTQRNIMIWMSRCDRWLAGCRLPLMIYEKTSWNC